jgi:DNA-nicking Smr family endonuclease
MPDAPPWEDPIEMPLNGVLDLHTFRPQEVGEVVEAFIEASAEAGLRDLRIIHGKGIGTLRETVHRLLSRHPLVETYRLAPAESGGWGATLARLKNPPRERSETGRPCP